MKRLKMSNCKDKKHSKRLKRVNDSGIIILVVLWVLVIISALALGLGRRTNIDLLLTKNTLSRLKAKSLAWGGIIYAIEQIRLDTEDESSLGFDNIRFCGIPAEVGLSLEEKFGNIILKQGHVELIFKDSVEDASQKSEQSLNYGFQDEERKINLNGISLSNVAVLRELFMLLEEDENQAEIIAYSILDWIDEDVALSHSDYGAEENYYQDLEEPYKVKNRPFESIEELLLVRGMDQEIYEKIRPYVTIFPRDSKLMVNFHTASEIVLKALARHRTGVSTNIDTSDADSLVEKIVQFRNGSDGILGSDDDAIFKDFDMSVLTVSERSLFVLIMPYKTDVSQYFRVLAKGVDDARDVSFFIESVIAREDLSILYWKTF